MVEQWKCAENENMLSKCAVCDSKKSRFIKDQEAKWLLSHLRVKTPLSKVPILGDNLIWMRMLNFINECSS